MDDDIVITVTMRMTRADFNEGWAGDPRELEGTVEARLGELIGDDSGSYSPYDTIAQVSA